MTRGETREIIIQAGREAISQHGFGTTGINAVLQAAGVPKGSFYYYFASKQDFGLAVIDAAARDYGDRLSTTLEDPGRSPLERLRAYFEGGIADMEASACSAGCLMGNLGQELAGRSEVFRSRLDQVFRDWEGRFAACLEEARARGEIPAGLDPEDIAGFILAGWEGAILRAKLLQSTRPMRRFVTLLFDRLLASR